MEQHTTRHPCGQQLRASNDAIHDDKRLRCPTCGSTERASALFPEEFARLRRLRAGPSCSTCGSSPAVSAELTQQTAMIFFRRLEHEKAPLCHFCGLAKFRDYQMVSLLVGWFGIIAIFSNFFVLTGNLDARRKFESLAAPQPNTRTVVSKPMFRQPLGLALAGIIGLVAIAWLVRLVQLLT